MAALWDALPFDLQLYIVEQLDQKTVRRHRAALRRLGKAFACTLYHGDWLTSTSPVLTVQGILEHHAAVARAHQKPTADQHGRIYGRVLDLLTCKPPRNMTVGMYEQLQAQLPLYLEDLDDEARGLFSHLVGTSFCYLDRYYVKRLSLATVPELCERLRHAIETTESG